MKDRGVPEAILKAVSELWNARFRCGRLAFTAFRIRAATGFLGEVAEDDQLRVLSDQRAPRLGSG